EVPESGGLEADSKDREDALIADILQEHRNNPLRKLAAENYFFGFLLQSGKEKKYKRVKLDALPALCLAPEENCYYFAGTNAELLQYYLVEPQKLEIKVLSRAKFNKALKSEIGQVERHDFKALIASAVIDASQGQLLDGHSVKQKIMLRNMPDVADGSILSQYKDIAEYMHQQPVNLFDVAERLQVPMSDIFDFYNVCYLLGYVKVTAADSKESEGENSKTLGRFLKSFFTK
ncbi:MAG: hypothetical protein KAJ63_03810, partial [Methyloprofundus sp.]|nr:hypothetical protein [Methyloprofundus sp.]